VLGSGGGAALLLGLRGRGLALGTLRYSVCIESRSEATRCANAAKSARAALRSASLTASSVSLSARLQIYGLLLGKHTRNVEVVTMFAVHGQRLRVAVGQQPVAQLYHEAIVVGARRRHRRVVLGDRSRSAMSAMSAMTRAWNNGAKRKAGDEE